MTDSEVREMVASFANAADLVMRAGFDGVEIHGANGWLIQQFVSAATNLRTDDWGGSLNKRLRFPLAIVDAIDAVRQKNNRPDFIIGYRFSPEEPGENGITMFETLALVDALLTRPIQYLHVSLWDFYKKARRGIDSLISFIAPLPTMRVMEMRGVSNRHLAATLAGILAIAPANAHFSVGGARTAGRLHSCGVDDRRAGCGRRYLLDLRTPPIAGAPRV